MTTTLKSRKVEVPSLTPGGYARIAQRVTEIRERRLPSLLPLLTDRERDERDVAEFERLLQESDELDALLAQARIIEDDPTGFEGRVELGMRVRIALSDDSETWVRPVHPSEAFLDDERISVTSPLGTALLGARTDHVVWVAAPAGVWACTVLEVDPRVSE